MVEGKNSFPNKNDNVPKRFEFGENWQQFLKLVDDEHICEAERSLSEMLEASDLSRMCFLDVGCGSGLFSLAARRMGARVHSFDYDEQSVLCTQELKRRFFHNDEKWSIEQASVLDRAYLRSLTKFDIVYAWGVLHSTGAMWQSLENVTIPLARGGKVFISIYNHQRFWSSFWALVKRFYIFSPALVRTMLVYFFYLYYCTGLFVFDILRGIHPLARHRSPCYRGMNMCIDVRDWIGGWPFEVAVPSEIVNFFRDRFSFVLIKIRTCGDRHGCNEFVFQAPNIPPQNPNQQL